MKSAAIATPLWSCPAPPSCRRARPGADGKVLVVGAIERAPKGRGRARLAIIPDAKSQALREFIAASIAPGSVVISDALGSYPSALASSEYEYNPINVKRRD